MLNMHPTVVAEFNQFMHYRSVVQTVVTGTKLAKTPFYGTAVFVAAITEFNVFQMNGDNSLIIFFNRSDNIAAGGTEMTGVQQQGGLRAFFHKPLQFILIFNALLHVIMESGFDTELSAYTNHFVNASTVGIKIDFAVRFAGT